MIQKQKTWSEETMLLINKLTPNIKGKSFDPDWFLLRERFEKIDILIENYDYLLSKRDKDLHQDELYRKIKSVD